MSNNSSDNLLIFQSIPAVNFGTPAAAAPSPVSSGLRKIQGTAVIVYVPAANYQRGIVMIEMDPAMAILIMSYVSGTLAGIIDADTSTAISDIRGFAQGGTLRFLLVVLKQYNIPLPTTAAWPGTAQVIRTRFRVFRNVSASPPAATPEPGQFCGTNYIEGCSKCGAGSMMDVCLDCMPKFGKIF